MADGAKRYRGQIQTIEGSPTGEAINITRFEKDTCGLPKYIGEAKVLSEDNEHFFFIQKIEYDSCLDIESIKTAINKCSTGATAVSVDTLSNPGFIKISITGGAFDQINPGDQIFLTTGSNNIRNPFVDKVLNDSELLIKAEGITAVDEIATPIDFEDLIFILKHESTKEFHKRRWDKRSLYYYA